jgi:PAS domain-containing protein
MLLEFVRIEEANDLLNQLIEHHPHAIFVTDHTLKIKYYNKAFQAFTRSKKSDILEHDFCDVIGCNDGEKVHGHPDAPCLACQLKELVTGASLSEMELIRDFYIHNKKVTKHLHIDVYRVVMRGEKYRLVVIDDRTQKNVLSAGRK